MKRIYPIPTIDFLPFDELDENIFVTLIYSQGTWDAVKDKVRIFFDTKIKIQEATLTHWDSLFDQARGEIIYSVGGGLAVDAAKYLAFKKNLPLICLPTALSVDAFFTWASGVRENRCVRYLETKPPDRVVIDFEVLSQAPKSLRAAGICDVLSIATGCWDWQYAEKKGENPPGMRFIPYVAETAKNILQGALSCSEAAGRGDPDGLKQLLDCLALEVQLCNLIGHSRPEEGSEHYLAYAAENKLEGVHPHAELVAPGILQFAELQGQNVKPLKKALEACYIRLDKIPKNTMKEILKRLPAYCSKHNLPYGLAHELNENKHSS